MLFLKKLSKETKAKGKEIKKEQNKSKQTSKQRNKTISANEKGEKGLNHRSNNAPCQFQRTSHIPSIHTR
jgi:hypothetical protein